MLQDEAEQNENMSVHKAHKGLKCWLTLQPRKFLVEHLNSTHRIWLLEDPNEIIYVVYKYKMVFPSSEIALTTWFYLF